MKYAALLAAILIGLTACRGNTDQSNLKEIQRARAGDLDVVMLSDDGTLSHGKDSFVVEFRQGNDLVDVGTVKAGATMAMAGMPPMLGSVFLDRTDTPGRYTGTADLGMAGGWSLKVSWDGPRGKGDATLSPPVQ